jgi:hypothetical protein
MIVLTCVKAKDKFELDSGRIWLLLEQTTEKTGRFSGHFCGCLFARRTTVLGLL